MKNKLYLVKLTVALIFCTEFSYSQEFGIQLYSLRNEFKVDIEKSIKSISDWGIKIVEGGDLYGMQSKDFLNLLNKYNIKTVSIGASFEDLKNNIEKVIAEVEKYDVKYVMCGWIPHEGDFNIKNAESAIMVFNSAGEILKKKGVTLAYHIHGYEFSTYKSGTLFDYIAQNSENFSFQMDVFWVHHGGVNPLSLLNKYPNKFVMMHLKDMKKGVVGDRSGSQDIEDNVVLGSGQIDIKELVKRGSELGIKYMFIEDESSLVMKQVPLSLKFLKTINLN